MVDEEIIRSIRNRDGSAMELIIEKYSRLLWRVTADALNGMGSEYDAEECVADVYVALWERPEAFDPSRGTLKGWLCMVARCKAIDRYREIARRNTVSIDQIAEIGEDETQETLLKNETRRELSDAIDSLDGTERNILLRRYEDGQKPRAIAKALGLTVKQVDNYLYRTKRKLRLSIKKREETK